MSSSSSPPHHPRCQCQSCLASQPFNPSGVLLQYTVGLQGAVSNVYLQPLTGEDAQRILQGQVPYTLPQHNPQVAVGGTSFPGLHPLQAQFPHPHNPVHNEAVGAALSGDEHAQLIDLDDPPPMHPPPNQCQPATVERIEGWLDQIPPGTLLDSAPQSLIDGREGQIIPPNPLRGGHRVRGSGRGGQRGGRTAPHNQNNGRHGRGGGRGRRRHRVAVESSSSEEAVQDTPPQGQDEIRDAAQSEVPDHQPQENKTPWYFFFDDLEVSPASCAHSQSDSNEVDADSPRRQHAGLDGCSDSDGGVAVSLAPTVKPEKNVDKGKGRANDNLDLSCFSEEARHRILDHRPFRILVRMLSSMKTALNFEYIVSVWLDARRNHLRYTFAKLIELARPIALEQLGETEGLMVLVDAFTHWTAYALHYEQILMEMYVRVDSLLDAAPRRFEDALAVEDDDAAEWVLEHPPQWLLKDIEQQMREIHHGYMYTEYGVTATFDNWRQSFGSFREMIRRAAPEHLPLVDEAQRCQPRWNPYPDGEEENLPNMPVMTDITEHEDLDVALALSGLDFEGAESKAAALPW